MVELVDTQDLSDLTFWVKTLSALGETQGVEPLKFGEAFRLVIPSQVHNYVERCRDLTGGTYVHLQ